MHYTNKYNSYGFSSPMEPKLRAYTANYLDGSLENYSSIIIDGNDGNFIAEGWMEFVFNGDVLIIYWDLLEFSKDLLALGKCFNKSEFGMPPHISKIIGGHS